MKVCIEEIQAIDVHAHFGSYANSKCEFLRSMRTASVNDIVSYAKLSNIRLTIVSPFSALMPRMSNDAVAGNIEADREVSEIDGLMHWVVVDPLKPQTFTQADEMLKSSKCAGIKIHPVEHGYHILEYGSRIFEFAQEKGAIILTHSGEEGCMPEDYVGLADGFSGAKLILGHLGCGWDGNVTYQVRAVQASKHGNVYTDTSSIISSTPNLIEWAVGEIGAERILFGTDSPCYYAPMQRARIDTAGISDLDKRMILRDNAIKLLGLNNL